MRDHLERLCPGPTTDRIKLSHRWLASLLAATLMIGVAAASASDQIYSFVDEQGVVHLSNVPADPRYQATIQAMQGTDEMIESPRTAEAEQARALVMEEDLPPPPPNESFTPLMISPHQSDESPHQSDER
jgi:hypothetical protein